MCGLNGIYAFRGAANSPRQEELRATRDHMVRRGPDGSGEWWSSDRRCGLGHRRLSIIDLSERALQPMLSADGRYAIAFNGEIYNFAELRRELEVAGRSFRTTSDTEVLLHLFATEGEAMVLRLRGMFAFAIWDDERKSLFLARDPYGIKPLYTSCDGGTFRFASQVRALVAGGGVSGEPSAAGVVGFHIWGSVPEPFTLYRDILAFPPGHTQVVDQLGPREPRCYASVAKVLADGDRGAAAAEHDVAPRIRSAVLESVRAHLVADVEVAVFLSAGVDSGALLGLMRDAGQEMVRAITLEFEEFVGTSENEVPLAARVAALYGAKHIVRRVSKTEFADNLDQILADMDQPSIDGVNTWFVAKAAREAGLKVALSGVGADELLAGYPSFEDIPRWVRLLNAPSRIPGAGRAARSLLTWLGFADRSPKSVGMLEYGGSYAGAYLLRRSLYLPFELATVLDPEFAADGLRRLDPLCAVSASMSPSSASPVARVSALESVNYMRNQLLRDADWAGMAHSVEIRTPFVDVDLLRQLSSVVPCLGDRRGKLALAAAPSTPLPQAVADRPKTGFGVPTGDWLGGSGASRTKGGASRDWALEVFASAQ